MLPIGPPPLTLSILPRISAPEDTLPPSSHSCLNLNYLQLAVIAGGSRGLGKSLAIELAKRGMLQVQSKAAP